MKIKLKFKQVYWSLKDLYISYLKKTGNWKRFAEIRFHDTFGRSINWNQPRDLNEWINYFAFCTDTSLWVKCADKYAVREYVKSKGLEHILVPLFGKWDKAEDIDFDQLPNEFVMKPNNGSYDAVIVKDKAKIHVEEVRLKMKNALTAHFGYESGEIHYLKMSPCIIAEQLLKTDNIHGLTDYKIWCFYGKPYAFFVCCDRDNQAHQVHYDYYTLDWQRHPEKMAEAYRHDIVLPKPKNLEKMIQYASKLSEGIPQVRVDFYNIDGIVYFGEMTFTCNQGRIPFYTQQTLNDLGLQLLKEKQVYEGKK